MYPERELTRLAARKAALRREITFHRTQCAVAAARLTQPLVWLDHMLAFWRRLAPLAPYLAVPLGILITRIVFPRRKILGLLVRWGPAVFSAARSFTAPVQHRSGSSPSANHRR